MRHPYSFSFSTEIWARQEVPRSFCRNPERPLPREPLSRSARHKGNRWLSCLHPCVFLSVCLSARALVFFVCFVIYARVTCVCVPCSVCVRACVRTLCSLLSLQPPLVFAPDDRYKAEVWNVWRAPGSQLQAKGFVMSTDSGQRADRQKKWINGWLSASKEQRRTTERRNFKRK